ncbi:hypothetical protein HYALB_00001063 [Hymenoscyphus albidus]|uniref:Uncharacterized protein n=1 Tax=Hymenoscyphus albidus TaxID=595503 RepID=A0A9N9LZW4_9HELO|nr:hypothetical protein HYALB_00001063 [Hymenoscyphus albidus]
METSAVNQLYHDTFRKMCQSFFALTFDITISNSKETTALQEAPKDVRGYRWSEAEAQYLVEDCPLKKISLPNSDQHRELLDLTTTDEKTWV